MLCGPAFVGLAAECERLEELGHSKDVVFTVLGVRIVSVRAFWTAKWRALLHCCSEKSLDLIVCTLPHVLSFLQLLADRNLVLSTFKT